MLHLRHAEFWTLTPFELYECVRGYRVREDEVWYRLAWEVCHVTAPHLKRPYSMESLLAFRKAVQAVGKYRSGDEVRAEFAALKAEIGG